MGFVFQFYNLLPVLSATENVELPLLISGTKSEEANVRAHKLLDRVGLKDRSLQRPSSLSGGEWQRVAIARALVNDPVLIIADEPTGNLDSKSGQEIMVLLETLHKKGATILIVTHDPAIAAHTQRTIHLRDGKVETIIHNGHKPVAVGRKVKQ
jgi:putative ABC transport system ATP-binding protein